MNNLSNANANFIEISPVNFAENIDAIKCLIGNNTKLCIVMKSNAYGHGIENLIGEAINANPDYIGIAYNSEVLLINQYLKNANNKSIKIIRLAPATVDEARELLDNEIHIEEVTGSFEHAELLSKLAVESNNQLNVHLYIETGMYRMGSRELQNIKK